MGVYDVSDCIAALDAAVALGELLGLQGLKAPRCRDCGFWSSSCCLPSVQSEAVGPSCGVGIQIIIDCVINAYKPHSACHTKHKSTYECSNASIELCLWSLPWCTKWSG